MTAIWRYLDTGYRTAAENMALDRILLESRDEGRSPNTIRLLRFRPPAVLVGYHQDVLHEVRMEYAAQEGIHINRRITGGGAIYFDETSVGWEVIANQDDLPKYRNIQELFRYMCSGVISALRELGLNASFRPKNDIEIDKRKISGTGGTCYGNSILFQGTLLVDFDVETMIKALRIPTIKLKDKELKSVKDRITCLKWELGYTPDYPFLKKLLKRGFEKAFKIELREGSLNAFENEKLKKALPYFHSSKWIYLDRRMSDPLMLQSITKKPGGVIRVSMAVDEESNIIKNILITGDFFAFPSRAIYDLESRLKYAKCDLEEIRREVYSFFSENNVEIPGITPDDIVDLIKEALDKRLLIEAGLNRNDVNDIYFVTDKWRELIEGECDYLLLPYCAKFIECEYRKLEGCIKCGGCSVGVAYEWAETMGMKPITIQNFEHLMEVLKYIRESGGKGYIGCCCEAFYQKHRDDLEEMDTPGILIDIDDLTCYELGKQVEAYHGNFEVQTNLKLDTLERLLKILRVQRIRCKNE
jgi:lipoate-protein ligase A